MSVIPILILIYFIFNAVKKANEEQKTQQGRSGQGQFGQPQRPVQDRYGQPPRPRVQTMQNRPSGQAGQRQYTLQELIEQKTEQKREPSWQGQVSRPKATSATTYGQRTASERGQLRMDSTEDSQKGHDPYANLNYNLNRVQGQLEVESDEQVPARVSFEFTKEDILRGIIFSEILGPPKSRRR